MLELQELRTYIEQGRYVDALTLLGEMDEMSYDDKVNKIGSFVEILLLHLIKQQVEHRTTRSWDISIRNAADGIVDTNRRRRATGFYLDAAALREVIEEHVQRAIRLASLEALEGRFESEEIAEMLTLPTLIDDALTMILHTQTTKK